MTAAGHTVQAGHTAHAPTHPPERRRSDLLPALTGLVVGASVLFVLVFGIVQLTNSMYSGEANAEAPAAATK